MRAAFTSLWLSALLAVPARSAAAAPARTPDRSAYTVIVNPKNPMATIKRALLAALFLKKLTRWPDGVTVRPVDLAAKSRVRARFCREVIRRSLAAVKSYWQQLIFSGRGVPPPELARDTAVVKYVLGHPGAVGYVSRSAKLWGAKVIEVR